MDGADLYIGTRARTHAPRGVGAADGDDRRREAPAGAALTARCNKQWAKKAVERRRPRERKQRITSHSVHESGHAIAFLVLDQPFNFILLRSYEDEFEKSFGSIVYGRPRDCCERSLDDPVVIEYVEHNLIMSYCGGAATQLFYPHLRDLGDEIDVEIADQILRKLHRKKDRDAYRKYCRHEVWKLVNKHRRKIEKVAAALERWRILTDYEVGWIINKPRVFAKHEREWPRVRREATWEKRPGWRRLDRSHYWREEQKRMRRDDAYFNEETGDYYG